MGTCKQLRTLYRWCMENFPTDDQVAAGMYVEQFPDKVMIDGIQRMIGNISNIKEITWLPNEDRFIHTITQEKPCILHTPFLSKDMGNRNEMIRRKLVIDYKPQHRLLYAEDMARHVTKHARTNPCYTPLTVLAIIIITVLFYFIVNNNCLLFVQCLVKMINVSSGDYAEIDSEIEFTIDLLGDTCSIVDDKIYIQEKIESKRTKLYLSFDFETIREPETSDEIIKRLTDRLDAYENPDPIKKYGTPLPGYKRSQAVDRAIADGCVDYLRFARDNHYPFVYVDKDKCPVFETYLENEKHHWSSPEMAGLLLTLHS